MTQKRSLENLGLDGGWLCLDFINTVHDRTVTDPYEYLHTYEELLMWVRKTQALKPEDIIALEGLYKMKEKEAQMVLSEIITARELLYALFSAIAEGKQPSNGANRQFNLLLSRTLPKISLQFCDANAVKVGWEETVNLEKPLYPLIKSAYDLLLSNKLNRVKACGACGWLFLDKSKNNSRRWCDMQVCGSSVKAKRYYRKKKNRGR